MIGNKVNGYPVRVEVSPGYFLLVGFDATTIMMITAVNTRDTTNTSPQGDFASQ
jgi:hypothetical protein